MLVGLGLREVSRVARMQNHEMILCAALNEAHKERERASKIADDADIEVNILRQKCNEIARDLKEKVDACNERLAQDACSEREALELHAALLISQAHHNEVIFSATRNSIWEEGDLNAGISNSKVESLIVDQETPRLQDSSISKTGI